MNVLPLYVHRRVAVWMALPCTFTGEWQCNLHCHSGPSVPITLPLGHERSTLVRSLASGSVDDTAMYVHRRVAVQPTLPLGSERTDHTATRPSAYRFGTLDAIWQCETHCHSGLSVQPRVDHTATRA